MLLVLSCFSKVTYYVLHLYYAIGNNFHNLFNSLGVSEYPSFYMSTDNNKLVSGFLMSCEIVSNNVS